MIVIIFVIIALIIMGVDLNLNEFFEKLGISKGTLKFLFWALVLCFLFAFGLWGATIIKTLLYR